MAGWLCCLALLAGCADEKVGLSYAAYNHTDKHIISIVINNEGGILDARAHGEGGGVCCVVLPKRWRPGLMAAIKWQEDDIPVFNADGSRKVVNGVPATLESPWKEKTVEVPKYEEETINHGGFYTTGLGDFYIHFFPNDEVKVLVRRYGAGHPSHPYPHPDDTLIHKK